MATTWTDEQLSAISNRGGTLLVSAAAGSGKTAVLVERVLKRLTQETDCVDIDAFLMVTYTNAAAAELRDKLAQALAALVSKAPEDVRLRKQLFLLHRAKITTVHAFCLALARDEFTALGISPDFRLADEGETAPIMEEVLAAVLEACYEAQEENFLALSDLLSAGREDKRLQEVILQTYQSTQAHKDPQAYLLQVRQQYTEATDNLAQTKHGQVLLQEARMAVCYGLECLQQAMAQMQEDEQVCGAYSPAFAADCASANKLLQAIDSGNWDAAVGVAGEITFARLGSVRGYEDKAFLELLKMQREEWKSVVKKIATKLLCITSAQVEDDRMRTAPAMCALCDVTIALMQAYAQEKRRRNLADFSDLEHFAVKLLYEGEQLRPLAHSLSAQFVEVLVDEYQDTNAVQDAIFCAVSEGGNKLFMVGDVKQSIYSFRLANPYIFLQKYLSYVDASQAQPEQPRRIVLSKNFRSRAQVLEATNTIFRAVMSEEVGDVAYGANEALYVGAQYPNAQDACYQTEVCVIDASSSQEDDEESLDKTQLEARAVAQRMRTLLQEGFLIYDKALGKQRAAQPSDCTILLRSVKRKAAIYAQALEQEGLCARTDDAAGLLAQSEVRVMVSLLSVIDNPRQDVELIGTLRSPLVAMTEQQLAEIRLASPNGCFYEALTIWAQQTQQGALFLERLARWRASAADFPVWQLIQMLYDETGALGIYGALPNGTARQSNLLAFFERARAYESQGHRGLFRFLCLLRGMLASEQDFAAPQVEADGGAVRIMSIHKSKGLEFPVVFLADCAKSFHEGDLYAPVLVHAELGFGPKCRALERGIQYPSLWRLAIAAKARREQISEELRILYVAMTRARDKLIVTCASASAASSLEKWAMMAQGERISPYALGAARSTALWLLAPLLRHPQAQALRTLAQTDLTIDPSLPDCFAFQCLDAQQLQRPCTILPQTEEISCSQTLVVPHIQPYSYADLQDIPAKITATGVKRSVKAQEAAQDAYPQSAPQKKMRTPFFEQSEKGLRGAEIGTAHHLFMQFADFAACEASQGVALELARLAQKHILSQQQAQAIVQERITAFFESALYQQQMKQGILRREFKFSVLAPAAHFYEQATAHPQEQVLLQGVVDCLVETKEGFLLIDFKTDQIGQGQIQARVQAYRAQLAAYAYAVEHIFEKRVIKKYLYFFALDKSIEVE